jgi:hypothetical protein
MNVSHKLVGVRRDDCKSTDLFTGSRVLPVILDARSRVDVPLGAGSGVSKTYEKTPRKDVAENPRKRAISDAFFAQLGELSYAPSGCLSPVRHAHAHKLEWGYSVQEVRAQVDQ